MYRIQNTYIVTAGCISPSGSGGSYVWRSLIVPFTLVLEMSSGGTDTKTN